MKYCLLLLCVLLCGCEPVAEGKTAPRVVRPEWVLVDGETMHYQQYSSMMQSWNKRRKHVSHNNAAVR